MRTRNYGILMCEIDLIKSWLVNQRDGKIILIKAQYISGSVFLYISDITHTELYIWVN